MKKKTPTKQPAGKKSYRSVSATAAVRVDLVSLPKTIELVPSMISMQKILVPYDFSATSAKALDYARVFARQFDARIQIVHVIEPVLYGEEIQGGMEAARVQEADRQLLNIVNQSNTNNLYLPPVILTGTPWRQICHLAHTTRTDLIIIGTHGFTGLKHIMLGSTAEKVVQHAPCPTFVVRLDERDVIPGMQKNKR